MKKKSTYHVICGANHAFGAPILLRGVRAREAKSVTVRGKIIVKKFVVIFSPVITLKLFNGSVKLSFNHVGKMKEFFKCFGFLFERIDPKIVSVVIKKQNIITQSTTTRNKRCPQIRMNNIKRCRNSRIRQKER